MPKARIQLAVVVLLSATALALSTFAFAANRGGGHAGAPHGGGGPRGGGGAHFSAPHGGGRPAFHAGGRPSFHARSFSHPAYRAHVGRSYSRPAFRGNTSRSFAGRHGPNVNRNANVNVNRNVNAANFHNDAVQTNSRHIRDVLNSRGVRNALHNPSALRNPHTRSDIVARTAAAGWHHGGRNFEHASWRHRHGGYGWVGPLFWPFAYYDWYDYALWGYDDSFWGYGYGDIYAGLFAPYGYDDLAGYLPQYASQGPGAPAPSATAGDFALMCGEDSHDIAGFPVSQIEQALRPNDQQRAALQDLANASAKAADVIRAACPSDIALTAPGRLQAMQQRLEAMDQGVHVVQPVLARFWGLLSDEQKARFTALDQDQARGNNNDVTGSVTQNCGAAQAGVTEWPTADIERVVHPTGAQQARLDALKDAADQVAQKLAASCPSTSPLTPPDRLAAVATRIDIMLQGVRRIRSALNDFYGSLNDEQKAQFDGIGPQRAARG